MSELNIFQYETYEDVFKQLVPKKRGAIELLAQHIGVHGSRVSRMVKGQQPPTQEQAFLIADFFKFDERESEYFVALVDLSRASKLSFKKHILKRIETLRSDFTPASELNAFKGKLTKGESSVLFSSPLYYLAWLGSTMRKNSIPELSEMFGVQISLIESISQFLCSVGLCRMEYDRLTPVARVIESYVVQPHIEAFLNTWRVQAMHKIAAPGPSDYLYSLPMALGEKSYDEIKKVLKNAVETSHQLAASESSEVVACMNVDLFQISKPRR